MRYQDFIKKQQAEYFQKFEKLKETNPNLTGKKIYEMTESAYDFNMYKSYDCFRTSYSNYQKKQRECQQ